ncbi:MAG: hypothetical protein HXY20_11835 [Acidobacteria bacterium]|nr:hypothetical protein [Acidobacteriota bacterium]
MVSRFKVHRHRTGRPHFDLRVIEGDRLRNWSLLRQPPVRSGERRLAVERESLAAADLDRRSFHEEAFGDGDVTTWDEGEVSVTLIGANKLVLDFQGTRLNGRYEIRRLRWYPGNRWLLLKA